MSKLETIIKSEDGLCFFNKMFKDDTIIDNYSRQHPLYVCKICKDPFNDALECNQYRPLRYYDKDKV